MIYHFNHREINVGNWAKETVKGHNSSKYFQQIRKNVETIIVKLPCLWVLRTVTPVKTQST